MEQNRVNEFSSKEQLQNDVKLLTVELEKLKSESHKSKTVEKSLVAATGIAGVAALLSPIFGPTAATIAALVVAVTYIFLNVNKTSSLLRK